MTTDAVNPNPFRHRRGRSTTLRSAVVLACTFLAAPMLMAAANRYCGWIGTSSTTGPVTCATTADGLDCTAATAGGVCETVLRKATCYDGGTVECSTPFLGIGGNCKGTSTLTKTCTFVKGLYGDTGTCKCQ